MIRRFYCLCVILFSTNSQCSFPLHTLITDVIETCGGSARLQKLLNRLVACASIDTHASYVQHRAQKIKEEVTMASYPLNSFIMLVSAGNLDFKHSFTRIYSGKQQLSWHGTTVQLLQPPPQQLLDELTVSTELPFKRLHSSLTPHTTGKSCELLSPVYVQEEAENENRDR